jgi:hypothetical protein
VGRNLAIVAMIVLLTSGMSVFGFLKNRTTWTLVRLCGSALLLVMVLTHVAERFQLLPAMGWGRPGTAGHYLDLASAVSGVVLFCGGYIVSVVTWLRSRRGDQR